MAEPWAELLMILASDGVRLPVLPPQPTHEVGQCMSKIAIAANDTILMAGGELSSTALMGTLISYLTAGQSNDGSEKTVEDFVGTITLLAQSLQFVPVPVLRAKALDLVTVFGQILSENIHTESVGIPSLHCLYVVMRAQPVRTWQTVPALLHAFQIALSMCFLPDDATKEHARRIVSDWMGHLRSLVDNSQKNSIKPLPRQIVTTVHQFFDAHMKKCMTTKSLSNCETGLALLQEVISFLPQSTIIPLCDTIFGLLDEASPFCESSAIISCVFRCVSALCVRYLEFKKAGGLSVDISYAFLSKVLSTLLQCKPDALPPAIIPSYTACCANVYEASYRADPSQAGTKLASVFNAVYPLLKWELPGPVLQGIEDVLPQLFSTIDEEAVAECATSMGETPLRVMLQSMSDGFSLPYRNVFGRVLNLYSALFLAIGGMERGKFLVAAPLQRICEHQESFIPQDSSRSQLASTTTALLSLLLEAVTWLYCSSGEGAWTGAVLRGKEKEKTRTRIIESNLLDSRTVNGLG